jgi:IS605 OrfB family transposase
LRFCGKSIRVFEQALLEGKSWKSGCFAQDAVGDWWLCMPVEYSVEQTVAPNEAVGLDLGLRETAATSDGDKLEAGHFYRNIEHKIAQAQRRAHKRQAKRLHRRAARRRKEALHRFSRKLVDSYQNIVIGDVSSLKLVKTPMAKSVLDSGWGILRAQLQYKSQQAGRNVFIVNEKNTTRECSSCHALTGPTGLDMLAVSTWVCSACGVTHDRSMLPRIWCARGGAPRPSAETSSRRQLRRRARHLACARQGSAHGRRRREHRSGLLDQRFTR